MTGRVEAEELERAERILELERLFAQYGRRAEYLLDVEGKPE